MNKYAGTQTEKNLEAAFAGESQARNKYTYFASKAKKEGYEQIAALFQKTADNEKEHAKLWFKELEGIGTTAENLAAAAAGENYEWTDMYEGFAVTAEKIDPRTLHASPTNKEMMVGLWHNDKNVYYRFKEDGTGCTWDSDDDVKESEASPFNWEAFDGAVMISHKMIFRGFVPFYYEIDCLNAFDLRFHDDYSSYVFERIEEETE